jgi:amidase
MLDDGGVKVHPPIERVFKDVVSKLQKAGHEVAEWDTSLNEKCIAIMVSSHSINQKCWI